MTSVLIVDDQSLIRSAVRELLENDPSIAVIGEAANGRQAVERAIELRPDVVVMDIRMPEMDGIDATAAICSHPELGPVRVLILTTFEEDEYLVAALRAGASGFIGKASEPDEIIQAIRAVDAGEALLSPAAIWSLISRYVIPDHSTVPAEAATAVRNRITQREQEVLLLVARGRANDQIARDLFISPLTVKTHVNRVMAKLHAHDRAQLVIIAYESGLLKAGEL